jgi:hypothetical protein
MSDIVPFNPRGLPAQRDPGFARTPAEGYPAEVVTESAGIKEYLAIVRRQLWIVLSFVAVCLGATAYMVLSAPPKFMANSVVRLADARRAMTGNGEGSAYEQVLGRETDVLLSQVQVLQSRPIAADAVERAGLRLAPIKDSDYPEEITQVSIADAARIDTLSLLFGQNEATMTARGQTSRAPYGQPVSVSGVTLVVTARPLELERRNSLSFHEPTQSTAFSIASRHSRDRRPISSIFSSRPTSRTTRSALQTSWRSHSRSTIRLSRNRHRDVGEFFSKSR